MRAVCRSIAAHTISCSGWSASHDLEDRPAARTVPSGAESGWKTPKRAPKDPLPVPLPRLDSNQ
ncbi:hypothetical protein E2C00_07535 [Streptomyces sp. WAC05374]|nr:hypothetical protein EF905_28840 [Streptomyces sp. WAC05374]TDF45239.1 hypothetical protein E2B92_13055 [Streptomyces sp. WAC05374]TDF55773.1 hypothetical protein E2C02_14645 [Streptomyces sp. WAC05374]TDF58911.1 hypothetical protein E2C00_07535 [Streptomyces sp. WAC05374]